MKDLYTTHLDISSRPGEFYKLASLSNSQSVGVRKNFGKVYIDILSKKQTLSRKKPAIPFLPIKKRLTTILEGDHVERGKKIGGDTENKKLIPWQRNSEAKAGSAFPGEWEKG